MINPEIKFEFNQLQTALIAFVSDIELKLQKIVPNLPVYVLQTGDGSYMTDKKFEKRITMEEILQKTPRFVISPQIEEIQFKTEEDTNKYNPFIYEINEIEYVASVARKCVTIPINCDFVSPNFIMSLKYFEVFSTLLTYSNVFTYNFLGSTLESAYTVLSNSGERPPMEIGSSTRNFNNKYNIELQVHLLVPKVDQIKMLTNLETTIKITELNDDKTISHQTEISTNEE